MPDIKASSFRRRGVVPPAIRVSKDELRRVSALANSCMELFPHVAQYLAREMERATIVSDRKDVYGAIRMGSKVVYRDESTGATREVILVYPHEVNIELKCISILTPVGAALIGLSAGQQIEFQTPGGATRCITVLTVSDE